MVKDSRMKTNSTTLSAPQVAEKLGVGRAAVAKWCRLGLFPGAFAEETRYGLVWRIPAGDLKSFQQPTPGRPRTKNQEKPVKVRTKKK